MTPKRKAETLIAKMALQQVSGGSEQDLLQQIERAKSCAIACADELLSNDPGITHTMVINANESLTWKEYWTAVKKEIHKFNYKNQNHERESGS